MVLRDYGGLPFRERGGPSRLAGPLAGAGEEAFRAGYGETVPAVTGLGRPFVLDISPKSPSPSAMNT